MSLIEKNEFYNKIAEENYKRYLRLVCEKLESSIDIDSVNAADDVMALENRLKDAGKAIGLTKFLIEKYKGLPVEQDDQFAKWFTVLATAVFVRYMYHDRQKPFLSLMYPREYTSVLAKTAKVPDNEFEFVLQAVESSAGIYGPQKFKAPPDTPGEMLVLAILLIDNIDCLNQLVLD